MPKTKEFKSLQKNLQKEYLGKSVPPKFRSKYGLRYGKQDVKRMSFAIAKSRGIKVD